MHGFHLGRGARFKMSKLTFVAKCLLLTFPWLLSSSVATMCQPNCTQQLAFCKPPYCPEEPKLLPHKVVRSKTTRTKMVVEFRWNPPDDISLKFVKGYRLNVTVIHSVEPTVSRTSFCYDFPKEYNNITDWIKNINDDFIFDCFEIPDHCVDLVVSLESLPMLKQDHDTLSIIIKKISGNCWRPHMNVNRSFYSKSMNVTYKKDPTASSYRVALTTHSNIIQEIKTAKSSVLFTNVPLGTYTIEIEANYQFGSSATYKEHNVVMEHYIPTQATKTTSVTQTTVAIKEIENDWMYIPVAISIVVFLFIVAVILYCRIFQGKNGRNTLNHQVKSWRGIFCQKRQDDDPLNNIIDDQLEQESLVGVLDVRVFIICGSEDYFLIELVKAFSRLLQDLGKVNVTLNIPYSSDAAESSNFVESCFKSSDYVLLIESPELVAFVHNPVAYRQSVSRADLLKGNYFMMCIAMWKIHCRNHDNIANTIFVNFGTPSVLNIYQNYVQRFLLIKNDRLERRCFEELVLHVHRAEDRRFVRENFLRWKRANGDDQVIEHYARKIGKDSLIVEQAPEVCQNDIEFMCIPSATCEGIQRENNHISDNVSGNSDDGFERQTADCTIPKHVYVETREMQRTELCQPNSHNAACLRQSHSSAGSQPNPQQIADTPENFVLNYIPAPGMEEFSKYDQISDGKSELENSQARAKDGDFTYHSTGGSISSGDQLLYKKTSLPVNTRLPAENSRSVDNVNFYPDSHCIEEDFTAPSGISDCDSLMEKAYKLNMQSL